MASRAVRGNFVARCHEIPVAQSLISWRRHEMSRGNYEAEDHSDCDSALKTFNRSSSQYGPAGPISFRGTVTKFGSLSSNDTGSNPEREPTKGLLSPFR